MIDQVKSLVNGAKGSENSGVSRLCGLFFEFPEGPESVNSDDDKADDGEPEAVFNAQSVDEGALHEWENRSSDDGHDEEGGADFGLLGGKTAEGDAIDGG